MKLRWLKKWIVNSSCLMHPFEPLNALLNEPIVTDNAMGWNIISTKAQSLFLGRSRVMLHPTAKGILEVIFIEHPCDSFSTCHLGSEHFAQH
jgi:hypothetical protein